jgi:transposase
MNKRAALADAEGSRGSYASTGVSEEVRAYAGEVALALQRRAWPVVDIVSLLSETSYAPAKRSVERYLAATKQGETPLSSEKRSGRPPALDEDTWAVVAGWILSCEQKVDLERVQRWIRANLGISLSVATISRAKDQLGLSFQLVGARPLKAGTDRDEYVLGYFEFVLAEHSKLTFDWPADKTIGVDCATNSCRMERTETLGLVGTKQRKLPSARPLYTNNYVVGVTRVGRRGIKVLMFTHDPAFMPDGARWADVVSWCKKWKIDPAQIYYTKSSKKYCKEQQIHISEFHRVNRDALVGARIFHDAGGAFKMDGEYILEDGANCVVVLPPLQHGELSVLDNKLNAVAKQIWKAQRTNTDFAHDALLLLHCFNSVSDESISSWWDHNFLLQAPQVTLKAVEEQLSKVNGKAPVRQALADYYDASYQAWLEEHEEVEEGVRADTPEGGLDGSYWLK